MNRPRLNALFIAVLSWVLVCGFTFDAKAQSETAQKQDTNAAAKTLDLAKQVSAATGRPIFAIAGQST